MEYMDPLVRGIRNIKGLKGIEIDLARSKVETEAFEMISEAFSSHDLQKISFNVESMKINPQNVANLANSLKRHTNLKELSVNFNFNELDVDDIKLLVEALNGKSLESLHLSFKGCGLPRDAFKRLCEWIETGVEVYDQLHLNFTM